VAFTKPIRILQRFVAWNVRLSLTFDRLLARDYRIDGNSDFKNRFAVRWLRPNTRVVDIGGGKNPFIGTAKKKELAVHVTGLDISAQELAQAPAGAYDQVRCGDISTIVGGGDADLCICQALLEHVPDVHAALVSIASFLRSEGIVLVFVPSRNALFARLNLLLPERLKRKVLFTIFPQTRRDQGFRSYYNRCTPADFQLLAQALGFEIEDASYYYCSSYFSFFAPLHVLWRLWIVCYRAMAGYQAAETFSLALRGPVRHDIISVSSVDCTFPDRHTELVCDHRW